MTDAQVMAQPAAPGANVEVNLRDTLRTIWRGLTYLNFFKVRFTVNISLGLIAMVGALAIPWPGKMVVDHVILGRPIEGSYYPWFIDWFAQFLDGRSPVEMMGWIMLLVTASMVTIGMTGAAAGRDNTRVKIADGFDSATKTENEANFARSTGGGLLGVLQFWVMLRLTQSLNHLVRSQLFERIKSMPMSALDDQRIGDTVYRVMYDSPAISQVFYNVLEGPIRSIFMFTNTSLIFIGAYSDAPEIIILTLLALPFQVFMVGVFSRFMRRASRHSRAAGSATTGNIEEGMSNVLAVQSLGGNKRELRRFDENSRESFRRYRFLVLLEILIIQAGVLGARVVILMVWFLVIGRIIEGTLTPGDFAVVFIYFGMLLGTTAGLPIIWVRIQDNVAGMHRVFTFMDAPGERMQGGDEMPPITRGVEIRGASLTYPDGRRALTGVGLEARIGEIIALVGPTGAGKTSLAHLIPAYYLPTAGAVLIDGHDTRDIATGSLRDQVAYVFQETHLFSDSILDNIRYGSWDMTRDEVEHAARVAGAHEFISALPEGYDTRLGTVTSKLSVGQKQRIAIARGLVKRSRILILDEPTSALDPETEAYLVDALHEAARDRLVIVIAHRLSTISHADRIYFMADGAIVEQGNHTDLMAKPDGQYRQYVMLQAAADQES